MMNDLDKHQLSEQQAPNLLVSKPQRASGWRATGRLPMLFLIVGGLIIIGSGIVLASLFLVHPTTQGGQSAPSSKGKTAPTLPKGCTPARLPWDSIIDQTASGLHLTVAQISAQVQAGKTIDQVAAAQKITADQLHTMEINIMQQANDTWLQKGCITQQEHDSNTTRDIGTPA